MKHYGKYFFLLTLLLVSFNGMAANKGLPYLRNFPATEYNAHNRNYDVVCDKYGNVFFANFEGLLYYDGSTWRKIHTKDINRVTRLACDHKNRIWIGGYNVFGYLEADERGILRIHYLVSDEKKSTFGEVTDIQTDGKDVYVYNSAGTRYVLNGDRLQQSAVQDKQEGDIETANTLTIDKTEVKADPKNGIIIKGNNILQTVSEQDGLCSNNVTRIAYDGNHTVWGTTNRGIFALEIPSPYTHLTEAQGLRGEVYAIAQSGNCLYVGTLQGLYRVENGSVSMVPGIDVACWQLLDIGNGTLLAATSVGLFRINGQSVQRLIDNNCTAVCYDGKEYYYICELNCVSKISTSGKYTKISELEKGVKANIVDGVLQIETIYGELWSITINGRHVPTLIRKTADSNEPLLDFTDYTGRRWITNADGKGLTLADKTKDRELLAWIHPLGQNTVRALTYTSDNALWVGGDYGVVQCDLSMLKNAGKKQDDTHVFIRQVTIMNDSVVWGGYKKDGMTPIQSLKNLQLSSTCHSITIYFSASNNSIFYPTMYHYRINGGTWSSWTTEPFVRFNNMAYGQTHFEVEAIDSFGHVSEKATVEWERAYPFYMRWWAMLVYLFAIVMVVRKIMSYRTRKLQKAKQELENIVEERTAELSSALDNLEEKNKELKQTQADLIRMERTATAGKLTQGLIDRILNPINYINNFSKLTHGLANDLSEDIEDEKVNMSEDNFDDCMDIIDMMQQNLSKIEEHGVNTTRTLRAMEAMLNNTVGTPRDTNMTQLCRQAVEVTNEYHKEQLSAMHFNVKVNLPDEDIIHSVDPESINKVFLAILGNAVYAVTKKFQRAPYDAEVTLTLSKIDNKHIEIVIHDNGIGMEETIQEKVFDPFFTTKPTGEASGVGLFLVREIIQSLNGAISLQSRKDEYTDFLIML